MKLAPGLLAKASMIILIKQTLRLVWEVSRVLGGEGDQKFSCP